MTKEQVKAAAKEIAQRVTATWNIPYSYNGVNYLTCVEMIALIIQDHDNLKK